MSNEKLKNIFHTNKKVLAILWISFLSIIIGFILFLKFNSETPKIANTKKVGTNSGGSMKSNDEDLKFIKSLPQLKWRDLSKKYCFTVNKNWMESVSCFIPNQITDYLSKVNDRNVSRNDLLRSKLNLNLQEVSIENSDSLQKFQSIITPTWDVISDKYLVIRSKLKDIIASWSWTLEDYINNFYILSLEWKVWEKQDLEKVICSKFHELCSSDKVNITIKWKIVDENNKPISKSRVSLIDTNIKAFSDNNWEYELKLSELPLQKLRLEATWKGKSIAIFNFNLPSKNISNYKFVHDFVLNSSTQEVRINTIKHTINWKWASIDKEKSYYIIKTNFSEYKIPFDSLVRRNWTKFYWNLTAYMFEFNKSSNIPDLLGNDIFDDVAWYAWNILKTFWMPFIVFVDDNWERIHVLEKNPMILTTKIQEMKALKTNQDKIYSELTDNDLKFLVDKSRELGWYPIDRYFLAKNNILRFPAFWVFDQSKWIWWNVWVKVISEDWVVETLFYTLSKI